MITLTSYHIDKNTVKQAAGAPGEYAVPALD
jgi:hypothetical protein